VNVPNVIPAIPAKLIQCVGQSNAPAAHACVSSLVNLKVQSKNGSRSFRAASFLRRRTMNFDDFYEAYTDIINRCFELIALKWMYVSKPSRRHNVESPDRIYITAKGIEFIWEFTDYGDPDSDYEFIPGCVLKSQNDPAIMRLLKIREDRTNRKDREEWQRLDAELRQKEKDRRQKEFEKLKKEFEPKEKK
jgi:hypothetical protein